MKKHMNGGGTYGLAFIGIAIYYIKTAASFGDGVIGFLKALVWPAVVTYNLFQYMNW